MLHQPANHNIETDKASVKKTSLGVKMFIIYTLIYAGFVFIGLSKPELMGKKILFGQNLAIIYGFGLIVLAVIMGFVYNYFCTKMEDKMNKH